MKRALFLISAIILAGCGVGNPSDYLHMRNITQPTIDEFTHCYSYGCEKRAFLSVPQNTRKKLKKRFQKNKNAAQERFNISKAIGIFEQDIGDIVGTKSDKYGTFRIFKGNSEKYDKRFQQDCVDESTNTTIYLMLLKQMDLLQFHIPTFPQSRQPFITGNRWWHQSATIQEIETGTRYAVDSWFHDNGAPAEIVAYDEWKRGWKPEK